MTTDNATADIDAKPKLSAKDEVRALLDRLSDDVTLEDIAAARALRARPGGKTAFAGKATVVTIAKW